MFKRIVLALAVCIMFASIPFYAAAGSGDIMPTNPFNRKFWPPKQQEDEKEAETKGDSSGLPDLVQEIKDFREFIKSDEFRNLQEQVRESVSAEREENPGGPEKTLPPAIEKPEGKSQQGLPPFIPPGTVKLSFIALSATALFLLVVYGKARRC